jgi:DNA invertase Pin-like site-specific DNA recombinase
VKVVAYLRVSTDRQAEEGLGLEVQEQAIRKWVKANGHRLVGMVSDEGVSGANGVDTRDGLQEALLLIEEGKAQGIVAYSLDRIARKFTVQEAILGRVWDHGGRVFCVLDGGEVLEDDPDDPMRNAMRQMRGVFSELDRALIAKRLRDGRRRKAEKGGFAYGGVPYGYRSEKGELVPVPDEQAVIARARELQKEGLSLRAIGAALEADGHRPRKGATWYPKVVSALISRPDPTAPQGTSTATSRSKKPTAPSAKRNRKEPVEEAQVCPIHGEDFDPKFLNGCWECQLEAAESAAKKKTAKRSGKAARKGK